MKKWTHLQMSAHCFQNTTEPKPSKIRISVFLVLSACNSCKHLRSFDCKVQIVWQNIPLFFQIFVAFSEYLNFIKVNCIGSMTNMTSLKKFLIKTQVHEHKNTYDPYDQTIVQGFGTNVLNYLNLKHVNTFWSQG